MTTSSHPLSRRRQFAAGAAGLIGTATVLSLLGLNPPGSTTTPPATPAVRDVLDLARQGDCLAMTGPDGTNWTKVSELALADCTAGTYRVLARIDGTREPAKCAPIPGYTDAVRPAGTDPRSFVICLHRL